MGLSEKIENYLLFLKENYGEIIYVTPLYTDFPQFTKVSEPTPNTDFSQGISHSIDIFSIDNDWYNAKTLTDLESKINNCTKCSLGNTRTKFVFGTGNPKADIMFIGEAPGADEDMQGLPFVGRAGQLLTKLLKEVNIERKEVYICNILKCRPPNNRKPLPSEIEMCLPYLIKQIEIVNPKVIVALGATAIEGLLNIKRKMSELRGKVLYFNKIPVVVTYHPAALLRNPNWINDFLEDLKMLKTKFSHIIKRK
jgi:DNA polymerase